jgi:CDP-diacylglycerol--glycerol-3-phosphate 3-phosphatidyltransferase
MSFLSLKSALATRGGSSVPATPPDAPINATTSGAPAAEEAQQLLGPNASPPGPLRSMFPKVPWHRIPNMLTYMRCLSIPAFVVLFYQPERHVATSVVFAMASITDYLDGFLARRWDIASPFGAFLDPVADKLMVSTALVLLAGRYGAEVAIPTSIILARELAVSALREWMAQRGKRDSVKVGMQGKVKTAATMMSLTILLLVPFESLNAAAWMDSLYQPGLALLYLCAGVTITSGSVYFRAAAPVLLGKEV